MIFNSVTKGDSSNADLVSLKDINFYDYDGTLLHSYTLSEVKELPSLPDSPEHQGLSFQGWNWSLEKVKTLNSPMNIGAVYITDDGKTRLKIRVWDKARSNVPLYISQTIAKGVTIDWGDGSATETLEGTGYVNTNHKYAETGDYTIALAVADGCELGLGGGKNHYCVLGSAGDKSLVLCNLLQQANIGNGVTRIDNYAFNYCYSLEYVTIPESVTSIGQYAFTNCYSFEYVTIPESVTSILGRVFTSCSSLASVTIPESVTSILGSTFNSCSSLASVTIPESVTNIESEAFRACRSLASVTIPESVTSIGGYAFYNCSGVAEYHLKPTTPPILTNVNAFEGIPSDCIIYVPKGSLEIYKTAENWSAYADHMQEESS